MNAEAPNISPQFYGITMVPKEKWKDYGHALLIIAGSDGLVSDPELEWLTVELAGEVGVDKDVIKEWENYDYEGSELNEVFANFNSSALASFNKLLIYDAIRMSSADGEFALQEKEQVYEAARILHVPQETVLAIEALVNIEQAANHLRLSIL